MKIVVSVGDINGIGLECFAKSLLTLKPTSEKLDFVLFAPINAVTQYLKHLNIAFKSEKNIVTINCYDIEVRATDTDAALNFSETKDDAGKLSAESITAAVDYIKKGEADIFLTLPINKKSISLSGFAFPGHTEMLGESFGSDPLMILFSGNVRVALVTVHEPIRRITELLRPRLIESKYKSFEQSLRQDFGIEKPRIAILGLNPHAGEQGNIGMEEVSFINDMVEKFNLMHKNSTAEGPFAADGFFGFGQYKHYDGILAMYHDQGLIPLKLLANGGGVNFTANLSIVRVSPDHGTAFPIAGKNIADPTSTMEAIQAGIKMIKVRRK